MEYMYEQIGRRFTADRIDGLPLFVGSASDAQLLDENNIGAVLNVAVELNEQELWAREHPGCYLKLGFGDSSDANIDQILPKAIEFIWGHVHAERKVLVHCLLGVSRSVTVVTAFLMFLRRMSFAEAFKRVRRARPFANPNLGFTLTLEAIEPKLHAIDFPGRVEFDVATRQVLPDSLEDVPADDFADVLVHAGPIYQADPVDTLLAW